MPLQIMPNRELLKIDINKKQSNNKKPKNEPSKKRELIIGNIENK